MNPETTKLFTAMLGNFLVVTCFSVVVGACLARTIKSRLSQLNLYYWIGNLLVFGIQGIAGNDPIFAGVAIAGSVPVVFIFLLIFQELFKIKLHLKRDALIVAVCIIGGAVSIKLGAPFEVYASFFALAPSLPLSLTWISAARCRGEMTLARSFLMLAILLSTLHIYDYPFLRMSESFQVLGITVAFWNGFLNSMALPLVIVESTKREYTARLERDIATASEDLIQKNAALELAEREKTNLIRIVCHDLSNSLSITSHGLSVIEKHTKNAKLAKAETSATESPIDSYFKRINSSIKNQKNLIENVKTYLGVTTGKMVLNLDSVDLYHCIRESLVLYSSEIDAKRIRIDLKLNANSDRVQAEQTTLINCVINNLLSNAIKFSFVGGTIEIAATYDTQGERVVFSIRDYGVGIETSKLKEIFEENKPTSSDGTLGERGTGFGMPIVRSVVERFGANIVMSSATKSEAPQNHGTQINIRFKLATAVPKAAAYQTARSS